MSRSSQVFSFLLLNTGPYIYYQCVKMPTCGTAGSIDMAQTAAMRKTMPAATALDEADWLPGMKTAYPYLQYTFMQGAKCDTVDASGKQRRIYR